MRRKHLLSLSDRILSTAAMAGVNIRSSGIENPISSRNFARLFLHFDVVLETNRYRYPISSSMATVSLAPSIGVLST